MLLKNENASIRLDFVSYEFPETEYGMDEYDKNWLQLRCTWVDEDGYTHKDSNACLLAQELAGMNAGLKVLAAGIKDRYDSDFISSQPVCLGGGRAVPGVYLLLSAQHDGWRRYGGAELHPYRTRIESTH